MRKLAIALLILVASASYGEKMKSKTKEKRFEPVAKTAAAYAGSYRGPSESYGLVLEMHNGQLSGTYVEHGRIAILGPIEITGSDFTTTASFDDGSWRTLEGSFANRVLNGARAFGVRVHDVPVEGFGAIDTFFEEVR
ncbi:MAG TPA: hypothetical protein VKB93_19995 [Thermoanaerobaculia bacterium]|nr:hypothetical protein [Thermoanaerobaculia bacterium]